MLNLLLEIPREHFRRAYCLYVIEVNRDDDRLFYVGQTGDNKHTTARPPFRRLAAHLEDSGSSKQNQIYRYIARMLGHPHTQKAGAFSKDTKQAVEDYLAYATVRMYVYRAELFDPETTRDDHLRAVRNVVDLEKHVIKTFCKAGLHLMNERRSAPNSVCPYPEILEKIRKDFEI